VAGAPVVVAVPEGMRPTIHGIRAVGGTLTATPAGPRWIAYGDSITEGWTASSPGRAWPAIAGRAYGLDVVNLGYAGSCRGEIASAEQVSGLPADVITLAYGTNCWSRPPHSTGMLREGMRAWLSIVREGHPTTPIVVLSPIVRPEADSTPNRLGASLSDLRAVVEEVAQELHAAGDKNISLIPGADLITAEQLSDGVHPNDDGQVVLARVVGEAVAAAVGAGGG
jgi:lysophospholipase L1-like esterase